MKRKKKLNMLVILDFIVLTVDHYFSSVEALRKPDKFAGL